MDSIQKMTTAHSTKIDSDKDLYYSCGIKPKNSNLFNDMTLFSENNPDVANIMTNENTGNNAQSEFCYSKYYIDRLKVYLILSTNRQDMKVFFRTKILK